VHRLFLALAVLLLSGAALRAADRPRRLNVIVILAEDLGWADLAWSGSDLHEPPHLDRLAKDGLRFTQSYSACTVCSATRAALLTGKYPAATRLNLLCPTGD
jgi:arylsulfatase A-like enzyme